MSKIVINGMTFDLPGNGNISINGNQITVDGKRFTPGKETGDFKTVKFEWDGPLASLAVEGQNVSVQCQDVGSVKATGSVQCRDVKGNVDASGSVRAGNVSGKVDAGGSVRAGNISGNVDAGGSVKAAIISGKVR
jgi:hypothetical protein